MTNTEATTNTRTAAVAEHGAHVAPEKAAAKRAASRKKGEPKANNRAKQTAPKKAAKPAHAAKKPVRPISVAEPGTPVATKKATSKRDARSGKDAPKANIGAKKAAPKKAATPDSKKPAPPATEAREGSKKATILELLRRPKGATLTEIAKVTHWQNHSIRGFLSGTLRKKMGLTVESTKNQAGDRTYRLGK
jgi:hypothetical protein